MTDDEIDKSWIGVMVEYEEQDWPDATLRMRSDTIVTWVDDRMKDILAAPKMWGGDEAVEMQVLQLLEVRALAQRPTQEIENPRHLIDAYIAFLKKQFPREPQLPLFQLAQKSDFTQTLDAFRKAFTQAVRPEDPLRSVPGWECRRCGKRFGTSGRPPGSHECSLASGSGEGSAAP